MEKTRFANITSQRVLIWLSWIAASFYGIALIFLMGFIPPPHADLPADQVLALYTDHTIQFRVGCALAIVAGFFFLPFTVVIACQMARLEKGWPIWTVIQLFGNNLIGLFIWLPVIVWGAAAFSVDRAPELTLLLHELGFMLFITPLTVFPIALAGISVVSFSKDEADAKSAFPRWIGYLTAWVAIGSCGAPAAFLFKSGIFSWAGLIPFWLPFFLFFVWMACLSYTMLTALRYQEQNGI